MLTSCDWINMILVLEDYLYFMCLNSHQNLTDISHHILNKFPLKRTYYALLRSLDFLLRVYKNRFLCFNVQKHFLVFMKPLLLKKALCSDWSAGPVCCDWSTVLSVFVKYHIHHHNFQHTSNTTQPDLIPFILHILHFALWRVRSWKKTQDYNRGVSRSSETVHTDIENNSLWEWLCAL